MENPSSGAETAGPPIKNHRLRWVYEYWLARVSDGRLPSRGDIDPLDFPPGVLPHLILVDVDHDPLALRYRLVGTAVVERDGYDSTGMTVEEAYLGPSLEKVLGYYHYVIERRTWHYEHLDFIDQRSTRHFDLERIMMPLSDDGERVTMMLLCLNFTDRALKPAIAC